MIVLKNSLQEVVCTAGEFSNSLSQTLIDENATEATPLKLGNVNFFRAGGRTCYSLPTAQWDAHAIVDDMCRVILARKELEAA